MINHHRKSVAVLQRWRMEREEGFGEAEGEKNKEREEEGRVR